MKITDLQVDGFGVWNNLKLHKLDDNMTVLFGRNEAGKTTLMQFVRAVLYGFSDERRARYLPPVHGGAPGGMLAVEGSGGKYQIRRRGSVSDESVDDAVVTAKNGAVQSHHFLASLLTGIDESIFNNVFAVGLREMQELGALNGTEAADQLYKLTSGLDRVSLVDVMRELERSREKILATDQQRSVILDLLNEHDKLRRELEEQTSRGQRWSRIAAQRNLLEKDIGELDAHINGIKRRSRLVEIAQGVRQRWEHREELRRQLEAMPKLPALPAQGIERLEALNSRHAARRDKVEHLKRQVQHLRDEAGALPINRKLWTNVSRIEALNEHGHWISSLKSQTEALQADVLTLDSELNAHCGEYGLSTTQQAASVPEISRRTLTILRGPARVIREEMQRLARAKQDQDLCRREAESLDTELEATLAEMGKPELAASMGEAAQRVTKFRRRIQLEERIEKMLRSRAELEEQSHDLLDEQVLPFWQLAALAVPFMIGAIMVLGGMVWSVSYSMGLGIAVALIGAVGLGTVIAVKMMLERSTARELDDCNRQLSHLNDQIKAAREERKELDDQLPTGGGALDVRLAKAEEDLTVLEDLLPLDGKRQASWARFHAAKERVKQCETAVKESRERWRSGLRRVNLPDALTPKHVKELSERYEAIAQLQARRSMRADELAQRERELFGLRQRIEQLMIDTGVVGKSDDPHDQLQQLNALQNEQQQYVDRREQLKRQLRNLRRELQKYTRSLETLERRRFALLGEVGAENEVQFRHVAAQHDRADELRRQSGLLSQEIKDRLGGQATEEEIAPEFDSRGALGLDRRLDDLTQQLGQAQKQMASLHEKRGEYSQEMKSLVEDRRLPEIKLAISCLERKLEDAIGRWQVLAATTLVLESIREIYEKERQPATLGEATKFLTRLTGGKYRRIWTPLSSNMLKVDDNSGNSLPIDILSQGTREAVFLSIRLALVAAYARRGAALPVVLDDVLVNLDTERAKLAAEVLHDFTKAGHQILLFTCHEHIMRIFHDLKVDVRRLPGRNSAGAALETAEPIETPRPEPLPVVQEIWTEDANAELAAAAEDVEWEAEPEPVVEPSPVVIIEPPPVYEREYSLAPPVATSPAAFDPAELMDHFVEEEEEVYVEPEPIYKTVVVEEEYEPEEDYDPPEEILEEEVAYVIHQAPPSDADLANMWWEQR